MNLCGADRLAVLFTQQENPWQPSPLSNCAFVYSMPCTTRPATPFASASSASPTDPLPTLCRSRRTASPGAPSPPGCIATKKSGITTLENKTRCDKDATRKVQVSQLAQAIHEVLPSLANNKVGVIPKSVLYRVLLQRSLFTRSQLAPTTFYRMIRKHHLLDDKAVHKQRLSFAMQFANQLWQADTLYGPSIKQADGQWKKTFLIAFIDDASRVITHAEFFYRDNTENMVNAFRSALYKRGKPERLYFDNGADYSAREILQACASISTCHMRPFATAPPRARSSASSVAFATASWPCILPSPRSKN